MSLVVIIGVHEILRNFWIFLKSVLKLDILDWDPQKMLFFCFKVFSYSPFFPEICSTYLTLQFSKFLFWMDKLISKLVMSHLWKTFQGGIVHEKNICKQSRTFFLLVPSLRYWDFRHLLQNPKVPKNLIGFNNQN